MKIMNKIGLALWLIALSSICVSYAQNVDVSETPSLGSFEAGIPQTFPAAETPSQQAYQIGTPQSVPGTETPSQQTYQSGGNQTSPGSQVTRTSSTASGVVSIYNAVKEGEGLAVLVINSGTTSGNITGWKLALNNGTAIYTFPNFALGPGAIVTVHPQMGMNTSTDLFESNFGWNETKDVELLNGSGVVVSEYALMTT